MAGKSGTGPRTWGKPLRMNQGAVEEWALRPPWTLLGQASHPAAGPPVSEEEELGDQVGDRPTLRRALRPARRLPWDLLCTSTLCSSDLGKWKADPLLPDPQAKDWSPRTGLRLGGAKQASWT